MTDKLAEQVFLKLASDIRDRCGLKQAWNAIDESVMQEELKPAWLKIVREAIQSANQDAMLGNLALGVVRRRNETAMDRLEAMRGDWRAQALNEATPPNLAALLQTCATQLTELELVLTGQ